MSDRGARVSASSWQVVNARHDARALGQHNSVFTVSNGYLGLTGNLAENREGDCPVTLIHGVYDDLDMFGTIRASAKERPWLDPDHFDDAGRSPAVANLPDPLAVRVFIGGREIALGRGEVREFEQRLSLRDGVYSYSLVFRDAAGRATRIETERFAALAHAHRVWMRYRVTPLGHAAPVRILSGIDGRVRSNTTRERQFAVRSLDAGGSRCILRARTPARGIDLAFGVEHPRVGDGAVATDVQIEHDAVYLVFEASGGRAATLERAIVLTSGEDARHGVAVDPDSELAAARGQGYDAALEEQRRTWEDLWRRADVEIEGDELAQRYLRFCIHHLLAAAPRFSERLSVPVKLLSGEYYQGNTFYDTDLYIVPFYTLTMPELARRCLNFRCEGLVPGRAIARKLGYAGAKLAWQAGPYGEECLGDWYWFTRTNIHINAAACYALMRYVCATGDEAFLCQRGIDLLVESARFYASRAVYDAGRDSFDLHDCAGPDEAHCHSTNNFYTNWLVQKTLRWAANTVEHLPPPGAAAARLNVRPEECDRWRQVANRLTLRLDPRTRRYEQYEGFYQLPPPPADLLASRSAWFEPLYPWQALNQPDVLMAMMLFRGEFAPEVVRANYDYYYEKSMNFSSMSFAVNSIMSADVGRLDEAYRNFVIAAGMDLDESLTGRGDTHAGLHGTAMGGAWMAAVFGFGGVRVAEDGLHIDPRPPPQWRRLRFQLAYRGASLAVDVDGESVTVASATPEALPAPVHVCGEPAALSRARSWRKRLARGSQSAASDRPPA